MSPIISDRSERAIGWRRRDLEKKTMSYTKVVSKSQNMEPWGTHRFAEITVNLTAKNVELNKVLDMKSLRPYGNIRSSTECW